MRHNVDGQSGAAYAAILGALAGDASGATLEFLNRVPTEDEVESAIRMTGGGPHRTAPGQITDDGEMMLCLMAALQNRKAFDIESVAASYLRWYESAPFDIGMTTINGLGGGAGRPEGQIHSGMYAQASNSFALKSKSNGGLMRILPIGIWGARTSEKQLINAAVADTRLTHANPTCLAASAVYCIAIRHLILNPGDAVAAFDRAKSWARKIGNIEVIEWLNKAELGIDAGYYPRAGFVKYGFSHAFRHLKLGTSYSDSIRETLQGGGDTDTNACIVGGMTGVVHGLKSIPDHMKNAVLNCIPENGRPRPEFLQTRIQLPKLVLRILD
jgi:ADP-ribosyl-[dinitrogen reductase] hydrolase